MLGELNLDGIYIVQRIERLPFHKKHLYCRIQYWQVDSVILSIEFKRGNKMWRQGDKTWGYSYAHVLCMLIAHVNRYYKHCKNTWYSSSNFLKHNQQQIKDHREQSSTIKVHSKVPTATKYTRSSCIFFGLAKLGKKQIHTLVTKNACLKVFLCLCNDNCISWIFGLSF